MMFLLVTLLILVPQVRPQAECQPANYKALNETHRSTGYKVEYPEKPLCDDTLQAGWYRFTSGAGGQMPETCVQREQCGTIVPLWMNGTHPTPQDGRVVRTVCANFRSGITGRTPCCEQSVDVAVTNCGAFYVYYLQPAPSCPIAYCAGTRTPCPYGKWSQTGFPPCRDAHPDMQTVPKFDGPEVRGNSFRFACQVQHNENDPDIRFEVAWTFNSDVLNKTLNDTITLPDAAGGRIAYLEGHRLHGHMGTNVGCQVRAFYVNYREHAGPWLRSNTYWAGIRVSPPTLVVSEAEMEKNVTLTSTVPLICDLSAQDCCAEIKLDVNGGNDDTVIRHKCKYVLCDTDWVQARKEASISVPVVATRDQVRDRDKRLVLMFETLKDHGGGRYASAFVDYQIPSISVHVQDAATASCSITQEPYLHNFARRRDALFRLDDFTVFENPSRNFEIQIRTAPCTLTYGACVCGVAIREGNDVVILYSCDGIVFGRRPHAAIQLYKPRDLSPGTVIEHTSDGSQYVVYLPSSAEVRLTKNYHVINVYFTFPSIDMGKGRGLCGTFDNTLSNEYTRRDGRVDRSYSNDFALSWRNTGSSSLFRELPPMIKEKVDYAYCRCDERNLARALVNCTARGDITGKNLRCTGRCLNAGRAATPTGLTPGGLRGFHNNRRRDAEGDAYDDFDDTETQDETQFYDPENFQEYTMKAMPTWPTPSGITEQQAEGRCQQTAHRSPLVSHIQTSDQLRLSQLIENCKSDILISDSFDFLESMIDAVTTSTQVEMAKEPSNYVTNAEGENVLKPEVSTDLCNVACTERNGRCQKGVCVCNSGFTGDNCQLIAGIGPQLSNVSGAGMCDINKRPCQKVFIVASNFEMGDSFDCKVQEILPDGSLSPAAFVQPAEFVTDIKLVCPMPDAKVKSDRSVKTYAISVTTDGVVFGNQVHVTVFDSACQTCNGSDCQQLPNTCLINDLCFQNGDLQQGNNNFHCDPDLSMSDWSPVPTIPAEYPVVSSVTLTGPNEHNSVVCEFVTSHAFDPNAKFKVSWYLYGSPYPRPRELGIPTNSTSAVYNLADLPKLGELVCKIRSLYSNRNIFSPYFVSNVLYLENISP